MNEMLTAAWADMGDADAVADHIERTIADMPSPVIAVPGGSTPLKIFEILAERNLDWAGVTLLLTDDREVALDHEASNQAKLNATFADTEAKILTLSEEMDVPALDLVWLGMGADGHIASLFPDMEYTHVEDPAVVRTVPEPLPPEAPFPRLSLNMAALAGATEIILVIRGEVKKAVVEKALQGGSTLPVAQLFEASNSAVTIYWSEA